MFSENTFENLRRLVLEVDNHLKHLIHAIHEYFNFHLKHYGVNLSDLALVDLLSQKKVMNELKNDKLKQVLLMRKYVLKKLKRDILNIVISYQRRNLDNLIVGLGPKTSIDIKLDNHNVNLNCDLCKWYIRGFYIGDGTFCLGNSPDYVRFESTKTINIAIGLVFLRQGRIYLDTLKLLATGDVNIKLVLYSQDTLGLIDWKRRILKFLENNDYDNLSKLLPDRENKLHISAFLAGLLDSDGYIDPTSRKIAISASITSSNRVTQYKAKFIIYLIKYFDLATTNNIEELTSVRKHCKIPISLKKLREKRIITLLPNYMLNPERREKVLKLVVV